MGRTEAVKPPPGFKCKNFFSKAIPEGAILEPKISKNPVGRPKKAPVRAPSDSNPDPNDDQSQLGQAATSATQSAAQSDNTVAQADRELPPAPTSQQASKRVQEQQETGQHLRKRAKRDHDAPYMKWFVFACYVFVGASVCCLCLHDAPTSWGCFPFVNYRSTLFGSQQIR